MTKIKLANPEGLTLKQFHRSHLEDAIKSLIPDHYPAQVYADHAAAVESLTRDNLEFVFTQSFTID